MNLISDYDAHKRDEEWNEREDRRAARQLSELERIQGMIDLSADLLKNAKTPKGRDSLVQQLTYFLRRKREIEHINQLHRQPPQSL